MTEQHAGQLERVDQSQVADLTQPISSGVVAPVTGEDALLKAIERVALNPGVDVEKMSRLLDMQERVLAKQAKAAFDDAMAAMQPELPIIEKKGTGHNNIKYALWEDVNRAIVPVLASHGFTLSFKVASTEKQVTVRAILSHRDGHSEDTELSLPHDGSGNKNPVHAVASSTSYGKRYTASALLNITATGEDDDGNGGRPQRTKLSSAMAKKVLNWDGIIGIIREARALKMPDLHDWIASHEGYWPDSFLSNAFEEFRKRTTELEQLEAGKDVLSELAHKLESGGADAADDMSDAINALAPADKAAAMRMVEAARQFNGGFEQA